MNTYRIDAFVRRLKAIGIELEFKGNAPWIYLDTVNGNKVKERFHGNHGFTAFWYPMKNDGMVEFSDIREVFKIVKKYR